MNEVVMTDNVAENIMFNIKILISILEKRNIQKRYINVYMPGYLREMIKAYNEKYCSGIQSTGLLTIFGCNVLPGYENKIVIANSQYVGYPDQMIKYEYDLNDVIT